MNGADSEFMESLMENGNSKGRRFKDSKIPGEPVGISMGVKGGCL